MISPHIFRPWGELSWALQLSAQRRWHFLGCLGTEERSIEALLELHRKNLLKAIDLIRIQDIKPDNPVLEQLEIEKRIQRCRQLGLGIETTILPLDVRLNSASLPNVFDFDGMPSVCLDISCLPKRFFFPMLRAAFHSKKVKDLLVLYSKPQRYPQQDISSNPDPWKIIDQFGCDDMDVEKAAEKSLVINTGFMVGGLVEYIKNPKKDLSLDVLVPFPAEPWNSIQRAWNSARLIEDELGGKTSTRRLTYHRVPALDSSTAFDMLLRLTQLGQKPAALAPLGPKPTSLAMCLLASQTEKHPVYYAQPKTYAVNYSEGYEKTYAYWIKHDAENFYTLSP